MTTLMSKPRPRPTFDCSIPTDLSDIVSTSRKLPNRVAIHALEKWGKTSFAAQAPSPIFLCTRGEDGLDTLMDRGLLPPTPHFPRPAESWSEVRMNVQRLIINEHSFKTLVIDTANGSERLCHEDICEKKYGGDWSEKGFNSFGCGIKQATKEWIEFIKLLEELRLKKQMAIILLFHTQVKTFKNPTGVDYDRYQPAVAEQTWSETHKWCDMILYGSFETFVETESKNATKGKAWVARPGSCTPSDSRRSTLATDTICPLRLNWAATPAEAWAKFAAALQQGKVASNEQTQSRITYDEGTYRVKIIGQEMGESNNGNVQLMLTIVPVAEKLPSDGQWYECIKPHEGREPPHLPDVHRPNNRLGDGIPSPHRLQPEQLFQARSNRRRSSVPLGH